MNNQSATVAPPQLDTPIAGFVPASAVVNSAEISGRIGIDVEATVSYQPATGFELREHLVSGPPAMVRTLTDGELRTLLGDVQTALGNPRVGLDTKALEAFADIVEGAVAVPSDPFAQARFGAAVEEVFGGTVTIIGLLGIGVDTAATIHDVGGTITWEHHTLPMPPGIFRPLTGHGRDGLTAALSAWLEEHPDASWQRILEDLEK